MSRKRDKEIADAIRNMHSLGDPVWRQAAIAHIKEMMEDPSSAARIAKVLRAFSVRSTSNRTRPKKRN